MLLFPDVVCIVANISETTLFLRVERRPVLSRVEERKIKKKQRRRRRRRQLGEKKEATKIIWTNELPLFSLTSSLTHASKSYSLFFFFFFFFFFRHSRAARERERERERERVREAARGRGG